MAANTNITEEDRRAATNVTVSGSGHRFEIQLGHLCNNRCVFCSSGQMTAMKIARPVPIEPIIKALEEARAAGATHLTFLGGEPTIHKRFLEALAKAVELGFEHIVIFTNGVMFPHPGFIDSVTALGSFEWRISIQGATEEAHVATTERPQSFQRILHGLRELHERGQLITANMCVNERSYRSLPHYPELIERYGVSQLHVDIVRPESTGERNEAYLRDIMPRYADMAPYYSDMLAGFDRWNPDFDINVGNLPYCVLPQWGFRVHHGGQQTVTKSSDAAGLEDAMNKYEWQTSLRTHLPVCAECVFRSRCTGIFRVYLDLHGGEEFKPVSREQLLALDPERRSFVVLVESPLNPLRTKVAARQLPSGWSFDHEVTEDRLRFVEMRFTHANGAARIRFVRPRTGQAPIIETAEYDVEADAETNVSATELSLLFEWLRRELDAGLGASETCHVTADAIERAQRRSLLLRGRQRVALHAERLQTQFAFPGWHLEPLHWPSETSAEVVARGARGDRVEVRFTLSTRGNRSQVGVDFRPAESCDPRDVKPVIDELVLVLRGNRATTAAPASVAAALS